MTNMFKRQVLNKEAHDSCILPINTVYVLFIFCHVEQMGKHFTCWNALHSLCWSVLSLSLPHDSWWHNMLKTIYMQKMAIIWRPNNTHSFVSSWYVFTVCMIWLLLLNKRNTRHLGSDMVIYTQLSYILNLLTPTGVISSAWHAHSHQTTHTEISPTVYGATRVGILILAKPR